ncbi:MAG: hypothetical protein K6C34_03015 [Alphaproteobacteria bacterium]|nr:hypothetical protein [Alphaproteobacteria bacterium]
MKKLSCTVIAFGIALMVSTSTGMIPDGYERSSEEGQKFLARISEVMFKKTLEELDTDSQKRVDLTFNNLQEDCINQNIPFSDIEDDYIRIFAVDSLEEPPSTAAAATADTTDRIDTILRAFVNRQGETRKWHVSQLVKTMKELALINGVSLTQNVDLEEALFILYFIALDSSKYEDEMPNLISPIESDSEKESDDSMKDK